MDIDRTTFWPRLPSILQTISEAQYVSMDLEMSGIASNKSEERVKPSLKQVYEDAKDAAETFAILQVGLTCVVWDEDTQSYVTKTFNIPLAPGILGGDRAADQLANKVERHIVFSSKTINFLQANEFKFSEVLNKGVPYLSAAEVARDDVVNFAEDKSDQTHIYIKKFSRETQDFYKNMTTTIQTWVNEQQFEDQPRPLSIQNPFTGRFTRFQKALIHQIVETGFPGWKANNRQGGLYMELVPRDAGASKYDARDRALRKQAVAKQMGFYHVWNAICGRLSVDMIDLELIVGANPTKILALRRELVEYEQHLKKNRPIVVGHNMMWDLCFLFNTFVGPLPKVVEDFKKQVRKTWPRIVDTKYLFTRGGHEMMSDQSLEECFVAVKSDKSPAVRADAPYSYDKPAPHQAGYDSYMTAIVFLKKACRLAQAKQDLDFISGEDPREEYTPPASSPASSRSPSTTKSTCRVPASPKEMLISLLDNNESDEILCRLEKFEPLKPKVLPRSKSEADVDQVEGECETRKSNKQKGVVTEDQEKKREKEKEKFLSKLPEWEEGLLWNKYGNKVRVGQFGLLMYTGANSL